MSSWIERQLSSHRAQFAATAIISGGAVACLIYGAQAFRRKAAIEELKASIPELNESHQAQRVCRLLRSLAQKWNNKVHECRADCLSEAD